MRCRIHVDLRGYRIVLVSVVSRYGSINYASITKGNEFTVARVGNLVDGDKTPFTIGTSTCNYTLYGGTC